MGISCIFCRKCKCGFNQIVDPAAVFFRRRKPVRHAMGGDNGVMYLISSFDASASRGLSLTWAGRRFQPGAGLYGSGHEPNRIREKVTLTGVHCDPLRIDRHPGPELPLERILK
jgi:hypothetical protein